MSGGLPGCDRWLGRGSAFASLLEEALVAKDGACARLYDAMEYSVAAGGKRYRPYLLHAVTSALGGDIGLAVVPSVAVELIHTYSLIHDDLPAMDDDDMRRGRPSNHKAFGEAMAILAGDALQSLAFELLCGKEYMKAAGSNLALRLAWELARAVGPSGMAGGQSLDLEAQASTEEELEKIHDLKTGALIKFCCTAGSLISKASNLAEANVLGEVIGRAFQVRDDIMDATLTSSEMGKTPGKDLTQGKSTYVKAYGVEGARDRLGFLLARAKSIVDGMPGDKSALIAAVGALDL
jgi:geranylgeranyl pyrophosphate synthase